MKIETPYYNIYVLDGSEEQVGEGETGTYYVVASNGTFMCKNNGFMSTVVPVRGIGTLSEFHFEEGISYNFGKIAANLTYQIKQFFAKVVDIHQAESCVILYYNKLTGQYAFSIPEQCVSHGSVRYRIEGQVAEEGMSNYVPIGTIHSHCDFQAFHSGVDDRDEEFWDGLHITFGHNDKEEFSISASVVANGNRGAINPEQVLEGIELVQGDIYRLVEQPEEVVQGVETAMPEWLEQILSYEEYEDKYGERRVESDQVNEEN